LLKICHNYVINQWKSDSFSSSFYFRSFNILDCKFYHLSIVDLGDLDGISDESCLSFDWNPFNLIYLTPSSCGFSLWLLTYLWEYCPSEILSVYFYFEYYWFRLKSFEFELLKFLGVLVSSPYLEWSKLFIFKLSPSNFFKLDFTYVNSFLRE